MRYAFMTLTLGIGLFVVACGGGTPTSPAAGSVAPGGVATPGAVATPAPGGNVDVGQLCAGIPTFSLNTPQPSFAQDTDLNSRFPTQIDGQPVTDVTSYFYVQQACYYGTSQQDIARFVSIFPPSSVPLISSGSARATINGDSVNISAFRIPGTDPSTIFSHIPEFLAAVGIDPATAANYSVASVNLGGKNAFVVTDPSDNKTYSVVSGDAVFSASDVDEDQAAKFAAAIP
jgi:hypothetical protein